MRGKTRRFLSNGHEFEIRAWPEGDGWILQCFDGSLPVGLRYSVTATVASDFSVYHGLSAVEQLMEVIEGDIHRAHGQLTDAV